MSETGGRPAVTDPLPADALYEFAGIADVAVAPDGERVAFLANEYAADEQTGHASLYVAPTDGSQDPHRLTRASDAAAPRWSPDGRRLGFVAARGSDVGLAVGPSDGDEDDDQAAEEPTPQVWAFDLDRGGDARQLTTRAEGVRGFDWGPDGDRVVVAARDPTEEEREYLEQVRDDGPIEVERLQHRTEGVGYTDSVTSYLFVVDADTGESRRLDDAHGGGANEPAHGLQPAWSPDGQHIAFLSNRTDRPDDSGAMDVYVVSPDGGDAERLTDGSVLPRELVWSPDSTRIAFGGLEATNFYRPQEAFVVDVETGRFESVSGHLDRTVAQWGNPRWFDGETIVVPIGEAGWTRPVTIDVATGDTERRLDALGRDRTLTGLDVADERLVCAVGGPAAGERLYALSRDDFAALSRADGDVSRFEERAVRLVAVAEGFAEEYSTHSFHRIETTHDDADGDDQGPVTVESLVYTPPGFDPDDPDPRPTVLEPHGGPISYDEPELRFWTAYMTSRGYVVCKPNFRGSTSYGRAFTETLRGRNGTVEVVDQLAAVEDLVERGWADPDRLFAAGSSYGGISTAHLVAETDRFAAGAPEAGVYDRRSVFGTADTHLYQTANLGLPWENPDAYDATSAITDVGEMDTPLLVIVGEEDNRCPPSQSEQLYVSVRKQGVPAKLLVLPGVGHEAGPPDMQLARLEATVEWFERFDPAVTTD